MKQSKEYLTKKRRIQALDRVIGGKVYVKLPAGIEVQYPQPWVDLLLTAYITRRKNKSGKTQTKLHLIFEEDWNITHQKNGYYYAVPMKKEKKTL